MLSAKQFFTDGFGKAILTLAKGSLLAQFITILISPLLTRIYSPQELGIYAMILTAESLFGGIVCGRYDVAIVSEKNERKVLALIKLSIIITIIFSLVASLAYGYYYFEYRTEYEKYAYLTILIFFMLLLNGLMRILEAYNNRHKEYKTIADVYVIKTTTQNMGTVILGLFNFSVFGMILSHTLGMIAGVKKQVKNLKPFINEIIMLDGKKIKEVMKSHSRLPIYSAPAVLANRFSYSSILLFIEILFDAATLGFYSIANKVLGLPLTVMSSNIAKVFYQEASREFNETGKFLKSFKKTSYFLFVLVVPMVLGLYFFSPLMFKIVFGAEWEQAGIYVQILAPMFGIRFIVNTVANGLQVVNKQKLELILQIMFIIASIICFVVSNVYLNNIDEYLRSITITFSIVYIIYYLFILKFSRGLKVLK